MSGYYNGMLEETQRRAKENFEQGNYDEAEKYFIGVNKNLGKFGMLKWLDPALEKGWDWDTIGYLGLAFD